MDTITNTPISSNTENDQSKLLQFIKQYRDHVGDHKDYINMSCEVLEAGGQTELTQQMGNFLANPVKALMDLKSRADSELFSIVDGMCKLFIKTAKERDLVETAFRTKNVNSEVCYGIILKQDNFESRDSIFSFLNFYSSLELAEIIPVHFQFIPATFIDRVSQKEIIA